MSPDASASCTGSPVINPSADENDLQTVLGSRESFVAERPFQDLAADMEALYGLESTADLLQPVVESNDLSALLPSSGPFAALFSADDREFWELFTSANFDWNTI
jgi:hypothetical protein